MRHNSSTEPRRTTGNGARPLPPGTEDLSIEDRIRERLRESPRLAALLDELLS